MTNHSKENPWSIRPGSNYCVYNCQKGFDPIKEFANYLEKGDRLLVDHGPHNQPGFVSLIGHSIGSLDSLTFLWYLLN